jgi:uncharacterized protein YqkB
MDIELKKVEKVVATACSGTLLWHLSGKTKGNDKQLDLKILPKYYTRCVSQGYFHESDLVAQQTVTPKGIVY